MPDKRLHLARPLGFCGGVRRALDMFGQLASTPDAHPLYVLHELVHNSTVTQGMIQAGAHFVSRLEEIPAGAHVFFGAHGVSLATIEAAQANRLVVHDATCPLVARNQALAAAECPDLPLIFLGDQSHPEVQGILGHACHRQIFLISGPNEAKALPPLDEALFLCQTTLDTRLLAEVLLILRDKFPLLHDAAQICEAVKPRQEAVRQLAAFCDLLLILGSRHSANAQTLLKAATGLRAKALIIQTETELSPEMLTSVQNLGLASATSTPDSLVDDVIQYLKHAGFHQV